MFSRLSVRYSRRSSALLLVVSRSTKWFMYSFFSPCSSAIIFHFDCSFFHITSRKRLQRTVLCFDCRWYFFVRPSSKAWTLEIYLLPMPWVGFNFISSAHFSITCKRFFLQEFLFRLFFSVCVCITIRFLPRMVLETLNTNSIAIQCIHQKTNRGEVHTKNEPNKKQTPNTKHQTLALTN